jgi:hypothetical protein
MTVVLTQWLFTLMDYGAIRPDDPLPVQVVLTVQYLLLVRPGYGTVCGMSSVSASEKLPDCVASLPLPALVEARTRLLTTKVRSGCQFCSKRLARVASKRTAIRAWHPIIYDKTRRLGQRLVTLPAVRRSLLIHGIDSNRHLRKSHRPKVVEEAVWRARRLRHHRLSRATALSPNWACSANNLARWA